MGWKDRLLNNMFVRNMAGSIFGRSEYSRIAGSFTSYFQYKIGVRQKGYYLYFPEEPFQELYYNEFFNKLSGLMGSDIYKYIDFHFDAYENKEDFLRFLQYELSDRLKKKLSTNYRQKFQVAKEWLEEKETEWQGMRQVAIKQEIEQQAEKIFAHKLSNDPEAVRNSVQELTGKLSNYIDTIMTAADEKLSNITGKIPASNIELNNKNHEEKLVRLLILLQQVQAPPHLAKGEQLFKRFNATDIASVLHLHFDAFRDNKLNTIQRKVSDEVAKLKHDHPKVKKLAEAMEEFFY